ncbi:GTP-binding protein [Hahella sp. HN01]|uniref:GTP-binding protein n=1 Tax=unclassified Hahella TaxID=2624107 RepID=UPI001C1F0CBE|nr:GTPase domain-containing protein [Hahella sp. HN01]MBU6950389.1 GTPase domain-containing protein [Hahella sp. HN01]
MAELDEQTNRLTLKLVYYGPALSGKTTNLGALHELSSPELKGEMMVLETQKDRTLFFDLFPLGFEAPSGLLIQLKLYTVPGQVQHDSTRKAVLSRADGVAFIADSQHNQSHTNLEAFENLAANAGRVGIDFERLPLVVQFNKRDLKNILSEQEIRERWEPSPWWPVVFASALQNQGVLETLELLLQRVYPELDEEYKLSSAHQLSREAFVAGLLGK